jgi:lipopolysaccharide transport system ATP-binding protein
MSDTIIQVENLGKKYLIRHQAKERYIALRDVIAGKVCSIGRRVLNPGPNKKADPTREEFWALKDVSFEIKHGEVLGIIGRNGAGKSTLLKILSRITEPTTGKIRIRGRVASLLEVGTGFHPELTGRENIYLNGAILGMSKVEIKKKFDEIVDFSEVEKFLDTPVKRYSSGMYVRLAFAIAAHLEPDILLVDEVLSVGDAAFQKKCLGKMGNVAQHGRTVLFVSHNMGAVSRLCQRTLMLKAGRLVKDGPSGDIISHYLSDLSNKKQSYSRPTDLNIPMCLLAADVASEGCTDSEKFPRHHPIKISITYQVHKLISSVHIYASIIGSDGSVVMGTGDADADSSRFGLRKPGIYNCCFQIPANLLNEGNYLVNISMGVPYQRNYQENIGILNFGVVDVMRSERMIHRQRPGVIWLDIPWNYPNGNPFEQLGGHTDGKRDLKIMS